MTIFSLRRSTQGLGLSPRRSRPAGTAPSDDTEAPSVPQNLVATAVSSSQIDLTWDPSTDNVGVAGYRIYRDNVLVHTSATNTYSDTGLEPATLYEYEVSAIDGASNESARSTPDSATTQGAGDTEAPSVPQNLIATAVSPAQIDLSWNASTDNVAVTGYNIYRDNVLIDTSPTNSYSDTGLAAGTQYEYEVSAFDAVSNESARSAPDSATTHQVIVTAGLVAEWRFDDGSGQVLTDYSGNGHNGQLGSTSGVNASDPTWASTGLSFDGGDFVTIGAMPEVQSLDVVFKPGGVISAASSAATLIGRSQPTNADFAVAFGSTTGHLTNEIISASFNTATTARIGWTHASDTVSADWHLLQLVWVPGSATWRMFLDGVEKTVTKSGTPTAFTAAGAWRFGSSVAGAQFFTGDMAYCLAYSSPLTDGQVAQNRAALAAILAARGVTLP